MNNHQKIQIAIDHWIKGNKIYLSKSLDKLKVVYNELLSEEYDNRSGYETYGYNNVQEDMDYISDRWKCAFRVRWMIDGIENGSL